MALQRKLAVACLIAGAAVLGQERAGPDLVGTPGVEARLVQEGGASRVTFAKEGDERRFVALAFEPADVGLTDAPAPQSLSMRVRVELDEGEAAGVRPAVAVVGGGDVWFKLGGRLTMAATATEERLPLTKLRPAAFNTPGADGVPWRRADEVRVGVVIDGPARGVLELSEVHLSPDPYRATQPMPIPVAHPRRWSMGKDPAVEGAVTSAEEGPNGEACMRMDFTFPGGRHMYLVPSLQVPAGDMDAYGGLRLTYTADLPDGIDGLLFMLIEQGGGQYVADPAPPSAGEWTGTRVAFESLKLGAWSQDANGRLDLDQVDRIAVGVHGTAAGEGGAGTVRVLSLELMP